MVTTEQMKTEIAEYLKNNNLSGTELHGADDEFIKFYYDCFEYIKEVLNTTEQEMSCVFTSTWRENIASYGKEYFQGTLSVAPMTLHEAFGIIVKWTNVMIQLNGLEGQAAKIKIISNLATDIPKLFQHIRILNSKDEQCIFLQISILTSNNPKCLITFEDLKSFSFGILNVDLCPYEIEDNECVLKENQCTKCFCTDNPDDKLVKILSSLKRKGVIRISCGKISIV